jgi:hypothetical protein
MLQDTHRGRRRRKLEACVCYACCASLLFCNHCGGLVIFSQIATDVAHREFGGQETDAIYATRSGQEFKIILCGGAFAHFGDGTPAAAARLQHSVNNLRHAFPERRGRNGGDRMPTTLSVHVGDGQTRLSEIFTDTRTPP